MIEAIRGTRIGEVSVIQRPRVVHWTAQSSQAGCKASKDISTWDRAHLVRRRIVS